MGTVGWCKLDPSLKAPCFQPLNLRVSILLSTWTCLSSLHPYSTVRVRGQEGNIVVVGVRAGAGVGEPGEGAARGGGGVLHGGGGGPPGEAVEERPFTDDSLRAALVAVAPLGGALAAALTRPADLLVGSLEELGPSDD